ncbi:hypothetical protein CsSME_00021707 [Camellia sinensis var. sinensis]
MSRDKGIRQSSSDESSKSEARSCCLLAVLAHVAIGNNLVTTKHVIIPSKPQQLHSSSIPCAAVLRSSIPNSISNLGYV